MDSDDRRRIDATNRESIGYEQVHKVQSYRLAEASAEKPLEAFDEDFEIRVCDLGRFLRGGEAGREAFAQELGTALQEIGFAILVGHGLDPQLYAEAEEAAGALFTRFSLEEKLRFAAQRVGSVNQGYFPIKQTSELHPDLVEGWVFCRRAFAVEQPGRELRGGKPQPAAPTPRLADFWPDPALEAPLRRLCLAQETLILPVMQSILRYLGSDPHLYDARLTRTNFGLRCNYYPPLSEEDDRSGAGRLLGHEDVDLFTFLPAPRVEGLQVLNRRNMKWVRLHAPAGSLILNTGDYMQRITNDVLPSTTHRVSKPRDCELRRHARVTTPMNIYLWEDEVLEVLPGLTPVRYPPVRALEFHTRITSKYYGDDYAVDA